MTRILSIILLLCAVVNAATIDRYVNPDADPGGDGTTAALSGGSCAYQSLFAWEAAEAQDLTDGGGDVMVVHCATSGTADTTAVVVDGFTTSSSYYVDIVAGAGHDAGPSWDAAKYRLECTTATTVYALTIQDVDVNVRNIQIGTDCSGSWQSQSRAIYFNIAASTEIEGCLIRGTQTSGANNTWQGIVGPWGAATIDVFNCVIYWDDGGNADGGTTTGVILPSQAGLTTNIYNCTVSDMGTAINVGANAASTTTMFNTILNNNSTGVTGDMAAASDYNATDLVAIGYSTPAGVNDRLSQAFTYEGEAGFDFRLTSGDEGAKDFGVSDPGSGLYSDDMLGNARAGSWDIGAFEFQGGAAPTGQVIFINQ